MEIKQIFEPEVNSFLTVRTFKQNELGIKSMRDVSALFNQQEKEGFVFFKSFRVNGEVETLFVNKEEFSRALNK